MTRIGFKRNSGVTLVELSVASAVSIFIMTFMAFLVFLSGRNMINVHDQVMSQTAASKASEKMVQELRNAAWFQVASGTDVTTTGGVNRVLIVTKPTPTTTQSSLLVYHPTNKEIRFYRTNGEQVAVNASGEPTTALGAQDLLFRNISNMRIHWESKYRLRLEIFYTYRGFALMLHNPGNPQFGQFITDVVAKNHYLAEGSENYAAETTSTFAMLQAKK